MLAAACVIFLLGLLVYFIYSVIRVGFQAKEANTIIENKPSPIPYKASFDEPEPEPEHQNVYQKPSEVAAINYSHEEAQAPVAEPEVVHEPVQQQLQTPEVVGQSQEELKAPEPLQEPVSFKAELASATDPYEKNDNVALFGSNLRHPEASFEKSSAYSGALENEIVSGMASQVSKPTEIDKVQFSAEMAQNGGEFMQGIFAYDTSEGGSYFSSL